MGTVNDTISEIKNAFARDEEKQDVIISTKEELHFILTMCIGSDVFVKVYCEELKKARDNINIEKVFNVLMRQSVEQGIALTELIKVYGLQRLPALLRKFVVAADELEKLLQALVVLSEEGAAEKTNSVSITPDDTTEDDD